MGKLDLNIGVEGIFTCKLAKSKNKYTIIGKMYDKKLNIFTKKYVYIIAQRPNSRLFIEENKILKFEPK